MLKAAAKMAVQGQSGCTGISCRVPCPAPLAVLDYILLAQEKIKIQNSKRCFY